MQYCYRVPRNTQSKSYTIYQLFIEFPKMMYYGILLIMFFTCSST